MESENAANFVGFAPIFVDCFALMLSALAVALVVVIASLVLLSVFPLLGCVVGVSFSLRMLATKRKGAKCFCVLSCPVVGCFIWLLYVQGCP